MINKYNNSNKKIKLSDFNALIDLHNKLEKSPLDESIKKVEILPAGIVINDNASILVKQFTWQRNGVDNCWAISNNYSNHVGDYSLDDNYTLLTFDASDFTNCPSDYSGYDGIVYIGACLSNCSSTENNTSIDDMLAGTIVQLSNPRTSPNKIHLLKMPIESYSNSNSNVNTSFLDYDGTIKVIGAVKLDVNGDLVATYQYHTGNIMDTYKVHPFEIYIFNKSDLKVNDGNIIYLNTKYSYESASWDTGDITGLSSGTNYIYAYISGSEVLVTSSTDLFPVDNYNLIGEVEYDGTRITSVKQLINNDIVYSLSDEIPEEEEYNKDLVDGLMGGDNVNTDTWSAGSQDSSNNPLGCHFYVLSRVEFDGDGEKVINVFTRKMTITNNGVIVSIGEETKYALPFIDHEDL